MDWTDAVILDLRALWDEGLSTAEIGRRLGVTKNAVVGKAHRLVLPARPSPIRRGIVSVVAPRRATGPTLPSMELAEAPLPASEQLADHAVVAAVQTADEAAAQVQVPALPVVGTVQPARTAATLPETPSVRGLRSVAVPALRSMASPRRVRVVACCWPIGEPGTRSFRFCDAESLAGKPYCESHAQLAYVKVRDRRDDAA